jgi:hypothetical protein
LIRYFRINDPYRLVGLLAILIVIYLPYFIGDQVMTIPELKSIIIGEKVWDGFTPFSELIDSTPPLTAWIDAIVDLVFGRSLLARHIVAFFLIFFQSVYLGIMLIDKKAFTENTFLPSVIFSILIFFSFDTLSLSGELYGAGFLLLALNYLFREIEFRIQRDETVFNLGLFISLASLCSFANTMYLLAALGILAFYTRSSPRKYLLLVFGFLLPHITVSSFYFLGGHLQELWDYYYKPNLGFQSNSLITVKSLFVLGAVPLFYLVVSVVILNREARFSKYQSQLLQAMFLWLTSSFPMIFFARDLRPQNLIVLIPTFAFFITHLLLLIRRKRLAEINLWVLLIGVVLVSYLSKYGKLSSVHYDTLIVKNKKAPVLSKKVLMLGEDITVYRSNELATGFFDWSLSKNVFEHPDYYENVTKVYNFFKADPPDVIIDTNQLMPEFFKRIPELKRQYSKTSADTYTKNP